MDQEARKMRKLLCFIPVLVLTFIGYAFGQDVAVFYDAAVENGGGLAVSRTRVS